MKPTRKPCCKQAAASQAGRLRGDGVGGGRPLIRFMGCREGLGASRGHLCSCIDRCVLCKEGKGG